MSLLPLVRIWLWVSVGASAAGWLLSAGGALHRTGYLILAGLGCVWFWRWMASRPKGRGLNARKLQWRFRHWLPLSFAIFSACILVSGLLYAPNNHTGLTYRTPRVLNWLAEEHWFWIHTANYRMNNRACGFEWLTAPVLLFTRSDRSLFLINFIPFLLMPGLIFSLFTRLGVHRRVAWNWMWLLPLGYTFILQAGSIANDCFPTVYALAAVDFACRAWVTRRPADLWHSLLAAALLSGAKASNLPLLLPWAILFLPRWRILLRAPLMTVGVMMLAALVSFLPTALLNLQYCHDWSGLSLERAGMAMRAPLVGLWGNALLLLLNNFVPPVFPAAGWWNRSALNLFPPELVQPLQANFENGFHQLLELQTEDWAGMGFGLSVLLTVSVISALFKRRWASGNARPWDTPLSGVCRRLVLWAPWVALVVYSMKSGMVTGARLISPYYPLLLPLLLSAAGHSSIVRSRWWQSLAFVTVILAIPVVMLTPSRPLWPARTILSKLTAHPNRPQAADRALRVYEVYATRADPLAQVRSLLPAQLKVVGFLADGDDMDISFWKPFGQKRVEHILLTDPIEQIRRRRIEWAVVGDAYLKANGVSLSAWLDQTGAEVKGTASGILKVTEGPQPWYVVKFKGP